MSNTGRPLIDAEIVGRRLRGARIVAGYDRVADACKAVTSTAGISLSERTLYAIERGEQLPNFEQLAGIVMTFDPPGGWGYLMPAFRQDLVEYLMRKAAEQP